MIQYMESDHLQEDVMATVSLVFKRTTLKHDDFKNLIKRMSEERFSNENRQGFYITQSTDEYVFAYYIYSFVTSSNIYDELDNDFKKVEIQRQDFIPFCLDYNNSVFVIFSNKSKANRVIEAIGALSEYSLTIDDVQIDSKLMLKTLKDDHIEFFISKVKVKDLEYLNGIVCDCTFKLVNPSDADNIFRKYSDQIIQYTIHVNAPNDYSLTVYKSGAISFYKEFPAITIDDVRMFCNALVD